MAVPKKRTGHSAQGSRRANWKATKPATTKCPNCGATVLTHTVCTECGTYKGQPVKLAAKASADVKAKAVTPVVEEKAPAKKPTAKKAATKKAETETKTTAKKATAKKAGTATKTTAKKTTKKAETKVEEVATEKENAE